MKSMIFYFKALPVFVCLLLFAATSSTAQNTKKAAQKRTAAQKRMVTPHCNEILSTVKKEAQEKANQTCETVTVCTECIEKTSKIKIDAIQVIQPACDGAASLEELVIEANPGHKNVPLNLQILQSPCYAKGINLEAYVPGIAHDSNRNNLAYLWEIDGKKAGHEKTITCTCGKKAVVRVTDLDSGISVSRTVLMNGCQDSGKE